MRIGAWVWFVAGIIFGELLRKGLLATIIRGFAGAAGQVAIFLGAVGTLTLAVITVLVVWWVTRMRTENARAKYDMNNTWNARTTASGSCRSLISLVTLVDLCTPENADSLRTDGVDLRASVQVSALGTPAS